MTGYLPSVPMSALVPAAHNYMDIFSRLQANFPHDKEAAIYTRRDLRLASVFLRLSKTDLPPVQRRLPLLPGFRPFLRACPPEIRP